jgi:hypothetical protein
MRYYLEIRPGQNELVLIHNMEGARIALSEDWAQVLKDTMVKAGAQVVERGNMKEYRL